MSVEDLTTYTEVDPGTYLSVTSSRSTFTNMTQAIDAYVYKDKGVDHFDGNFEHLITVYQGQTENIGDPYVTHWCLANMVNDYYYIFLNADSLAIDVRSLHGSPPYITIQLRETVAGTRYSFTAHDESINTPYYLKIKRNEAVGTYGTIYCYIYSDSGRTNLLATLSGALHEKEDFRYIYTTQSWNSGSSNSICDGYSENLDLQEAIGWTNIAKVSGVAAAVIGKINGVAVADIAKVNGVAV